MNHRLPATGRTYLFIGAGLFLCSLFLRAFPSDQERILGFHAWVFSLTAIINDSFKFNLAFIGMFICATWNFILLTQPWLRDPEAGTSRFLSWSFMVIAAVIIPALGIYLQFGEHHAHSFLKEGFFLYWAAYIISTIGFWKKRRALETASSL